MEYVAIVQSAGVLIRVMCQLGRDTSHVPNGVEYPSVGRLEVDQDPEGQIRGMAWPAFKQFLAILQL